MHKDWKFLHACIIVKDMDKAIERFKALGVGPFPPFLGGPEGESFTGKTVRGEAIDYDMDLRLAEGGMGGVGFELIQPLSDRSVYAEFLEEKGEGMHHLAFLVDDLDKEIAELTEKGFKVIQTGARTQGKFAYFDVYEAGGFAVELIQRL